ncbi:MAG: hypothetical protein EOP48_06585 [Sphingobacteriales bacterium]|nr:MAG: hypothetical protein EOP48_06585 [Sphingobacteriales bacterium]
MLKKFIRRVDKGLKVEQTVNNIAALEKSQQRIERKLSEISWGLIFNNAISNSRWFINKSVNSGRWAAGYPFLYIL